MSRNENSDSNILDLFISKDQIGNGYFDQFLFNSDTETDVDDLTHLSVQELDENNAENIDNFDIEDADSSPFIDTEIYNKIMNGGNNKQIMNSENDEEYINFNDTDELSTIDLPEYINLVDIE